MAYAKFDDPVDTVAQAPRKVYDAIPVESVRRALQGIANRVIMGSNGTWAPIYTATCADGSTCGVKTTYSLVVSINGVSVTCLADDNIELPAGTQGANTVSKYLISFGTGGTGTCTGPGNEVSKTDVDAGDATAVLPDCPDGHCAVGYLQVTTHPTLPLIRTRAAFGSGSNATRGTSAYGDFFHMPYTG